jgi:hypothetical protein
MPVLGHAVVPPDAPSVQPVPEAVLDSTPVRPTRLTAPSPVQDVVVQLPADEDGGAPFPAITVTFPMDASDLPAVVAEVADLAFVTSGDAGLVAFHDSLKGTVTNAVPGLWGAVAATRLLPVRGEDRFIDDVRTPQRGRLLESFEVYSRRLPPRRAAAEAVVEQTAVANALARLENSRVQVVEEARRYLSIAGGESAAHAVLAGSGPNRLSGPETMGLVADLIAIANGRIALASLTTAQRKAESDWARTKLAMLADERARRGVDDRYFTEAQRKQFLADFLALPDSREVVDATQRVVDQRQALADLVTVRAAARPLLYRLWDTDIPFLALRLIRSSRAGNLVADKAVVMASDEFRSEVLRRLRRTYQASIELTRKFRGEPDTVWTFEPLIESALTGLNADASEFAARVARDRVRVERPGSELAEWSKWLGFAQLGFALTGAPPVAAAFMVAQAAVDAGAVVLKAFAAAEQQLGEDAFLRPSARLGVPPSYSGVLMDALDVAIGVFTPLPFDTKLFREP